MPRVQIGKPTLQSELLRDTVLTRHFIIRLLNWQVAASNQPVGQLKN